MRWSTRGTVPLLVGRRRLLGPGQRVRVRVHLEVGPRQLRDVVVVFQLVGGTDVQLRQRATRRGRCRLGPRRRRLGRPSGTVGTLAVRSYRPPRFRLAIRSFPCFPVFFRQHHRSHGLLETHVGPLHLGVRSFYFVVVGHLLRIPVRPLFLLLQLWSFPLLTFLRFYRPSRRHVRPLFIAVRSFPGRCAGRSRDRLDGRQFGVAALRRRPSTLPPGTASLVPVLLRRAVDKHLLRGVFVPVSSRKRRARFTTADVCDARTVTPSLAAVSTRRHVVITSGRRLSLGTSIIRRESVDSVRRTRSSQSVHVRFQNVGWRKGAVDVVGRMTRSGAVAGRGQEEGSGWTFGRRGGTIAPEGGGGSVGPSRPRIVISGSARP